MPAARHLLNLWSILYRLHNLLLIPLHIFHHQMSWYPWYLEMFLWFYVCCPQRKKYSSSCNCYDWSIFNRVFKVFFAIKTTHLTIWFFHHDTVASKAYYVASLILQVAVVPWFVLYLTLRKFIAICKKNTSTYGWNSNYFYAREI